MDENDELLTEYDLYFSRSKPNRFADKYQKTRRKIVLDSDVADKFPSSESVNEALRFLVRITEQHRAELTRK